MTLFFQFVCIKDPSEAEKKEHAKWNTAIENFRADYKAMGKAEYDADCRGFSVEENQVEITFNDVVLWFLIRRTY